MAQLTWFSSQLGIHVPQLIDINQWLLQGLTCEDTMGSQIFGTLLWKLWGARNQVVFNHKPLNPIEVAQAAMTFVQELNTGNPSANVLDLQTPNQRQLPPVIEESRINVDVGCFSNGSTGWGLVAFVHTDSVSFAAGRKENIATDLVLIQALGV